MTPINDGSSNSPELHSSSEPFDTSQRHSLSSTAAASLRLGVLGVTASSALALGLTGEAANVQPPATSEQSSAISSTLLAALELTAADRTVVQSIQERAKHDPGFRNQLLTNPAAAIQGYKLSTSARNNLITNINKEKAGLIKPGTEESWCVCTGCCVTKINRMPGERISQLTRSDSETIKAIQQRAKQDIAFRRQLVANPTMAIKDYSLSPSTRDNLITNINKEKAGLVKPGTEESWCVCTGCCVTKINRMPGETVINSPIR